MSPRIQALACVWAMVVAGCEPKSGGSTPPSGDAAAGGGNGGGSSSSRTADPNCPAGGPSVSVNINRESDTVSPSREELGALLGWIGSFVQPCIDEPSQAHHITLVFALGAEGEAPALEFVEREELPTMAACLDESFAGAAAPPSGEQRVSIVVPWGCPTLGPGFSSSGDEAKQVAPEAEEPAASE